MRRMKLELKKMFFALALMAVTAPVAFAQDTTTQKQECLRQFSTDVVACGKSANTLVDSAGPTAVKACIAAAATSKNDCLNGNSQCVQACDATFNQAVSSCQIQWDPSSCGGNTFCEDIVSQNLVQCTADAEAARSSCVASCGQ